MKAVANAPYVGSLVAPANRLMTSRILEPRAEAGTPTSCAVRKAAPSVAAAPVSPRLVTTAATIVALGVEAGKLALKALSSTALTPPAVELI